MSLVEMKGSLDTSVMMSDVIVIMLITMPVTMLEILCLGRHKEKYINVMQSHGLLFSRWAGSRGVRKNVSPGLRTALHKGCSLDVW